MIVVSEVRRSGRTTKAIIRSAKTGAYIVTLSRDSATRIFHQAKNMGLTIPFPISFDEFMGKRYHAEGVKKVIIDDADMLLQRISLVKIDMITVSAEDTFMTNEEI